MSKKTNKEIDKEFAKSMDNGNFEEYLKSVNLRHGGVHFVSSKGYGKSTALKAIARFYAKQPDTYVIICDTILNFCLDFDKCPYYTVKENAIQEKTKNIEINDGKSYLVWAKEYIIDPEPFEFLNEMIKEKQHLILFSIDLMEIDLVGIFYAKLIDFLYQKQRIKKKYHRGNLPEQYVLISEETEAVFSNSTLDRRIMSRTQKEYAEMANLRIAMFSCSQRLTEISTRYRGKMDSYLIGHTSIEDFDLKLSRMLKFSKHREDVLKLPKGSWLDTKSDSIITFPDFIPNGIPYECKPKISEQPKTKKEPKPFGLIPFLKYLLSPRVYPKGYEPTANRKIELSKDDESEFDGILSIDDEDRLFPSE
ncbi:MAG: hypothetical protein WAM95_22490 [Bacillus sp. (in: firmicutes)]